MEFKIVDWYLTSLPTVMLAMIFLIASRFSAFLALAKACFSSKTSPEKNIQNIVTTKLVKQTHTHIEDYDLRT
jgi:hypothetical protein